jgi:hypothetical protein
MARRVPPVRRPWMGAARRRRRRLPRPPPANAAASAASLPSGPNHAARRSPQPHTSTELLPPTPTAAPAATLSSKEVATQLAVSYRQLHIWVTKGWIPGLVPNGSGSQLRWPPEQVHTAQEVKARLAVARAIQADPTIPIRGVDS